MTHVKDGAHVDDAGGDDAIVVIMLVVVMMMMRKSPLRLQTVHEWMDTEACRDEGVEYSKEWYEQHEKVHRRD
jgi:hypothetical protein